MTTFNAANPATGTGQPPAPPPPQKELENLDCEHLRNEKKWDSCMVEQLCAMVKAYNESKEPKRNVSPSPSRPASKLPADITPAQRDAQSAANAAYNAGIRKFVDEFEILVREKGKAHPDVVNKFHAKCQYQKWSDAGGPLPVPRSTGPLAMNPDHVHPVGLGGPYEGSGNLKWADARVNRTVGPAMDSHNPETHPDGVKAHKSCNCS